MLAIKAWRIFYADGSTFSNLDGSWAQAPPFGIECIVYYHVPPYKTLDTGGDDGIFNWLGKGGKRGIKMGLWMDDKGYYRIIKLAQKSVIPR